MLLKDKVALITGGGNGIGRAIVLRFLRFRVDKAGIVHSTIGRRSFDNEKLQGNLAALIDALNKAKPASSKGLYLRKVAVSSTMGVGVRVDRQSIAA